MPKKQREKEKLSMTTLQKATLVFFIVSVIYFVLPTDVMPFTIFEDLAFIVVAGILWVLALIIPTKKGR